MYSSLLLLLWGFYLKSPGALTTLLVIAGTLALFKAARVEEAENLRTFGQAYRAYIRRTRMFIPYLF
jgi:protein-S-isoprenylcysteine O-methyltransferase Ste14